jgi:hypothetical protein
LIDFQTACQQKYPTYNWIVLHRENITESYQFLDAFNSEEDLRIKGFIIHGERFKARELQLTADQPEIVSHMVQSEYEALIAIFVNKTSPVLSFITHIYSEQCRSFDYIIFLLTPMIVFSIVVKVVYGWKRSKSLNRF